MPRSSGRGIDVIEGPRLSRGLLDDVPGGDYNKGGSEELGAPAKPAANKRKVPIRDAGEGEGMQKIATLLIQKESSHAGT